MRTDTILRAVKQELERQRPAIEQLNDLACVRVTVKLKGRSAYVLFDTFSERQAAVETGSV
jgi:hypothetical protein